MKNFVLKIILFNVVFFVFTTSVISQNLPLKDDFNKLSFSVEFGKDVFIPLEPVFVKAKISNNTDKSLHLSGMPDFKRISIEVMSEKDSSKIFNSLFLIGPDRPGFRTTLDSGQEINENLLLKVNLDEMFPRTGQYKIRFILDNGRDGDDRKVVTSDIKEITIKEPFGIDKEAVEFLRKNQGPSLFWWRTDCEKQVLSQSGKSLLDVFAENYGETVFGEYAIYEKGLNYLSNNELEKAEIEFQKIKETKNFYISEMLDKSFTELKTKKLNQKWKI